ncbi:hypothetical protein OG948_60590 (plasmid) [Embleya sp. NBC_00888]|uniref:hypothetical protein n=1 Tax=Embleya sp. NBC_00888 TaxID=2975960 RepID=UPI002F911443|nr:hypothetical protein OG948_60590 [Embleya sp. NBC_00888]
MRVPDEDEADAVPAAARQALGATLQWLIDARARGLRMGVISGPDDCVRYAAEATGWSVRELKELLEAMPASEDETACDVGELGNVALARMVRGYGYHHPLGSAELHRRFPHFKDVHDAWSETSPPLDEDPLMLRGPSTNEDIRWDEDPAHFGFLRVRALYRKLVDDIAASRP